MSWVSTKTNVSILKLNVIMVSNSKRKYSSASNCEFAKMHSHDNQNRTTQIQKCNYIFCFLLSIIHMASIFYLTNVHWFELDQSDHDYFLSIVEMYTQKCYFYDNKCHEWTKNWWIKLIERTTISIWWVWVLFLDVFNFI